MVVRRCEVPPFISSRTHLFVFGVLATFATARSVAVRLRFSAASASEARGSAR